MVGRRYNLLGADGLDCPICIRPKALTFASATRAECLRCWATFTFEPATADRDASLLRIPLTVRAASRCECGTLIGSFFGAKCQICIASDARQQRLAAGVAA